MRATPQRQRATRCTELTYFKFVVRGAVLHDFQTQKGRLRFCPASQTLRFMTLRVA